MKLELRHLSGSRAGDVESFDQSTKITIGRQPSSLVLFDPHRDRAVSGEHASITFERGRWILHDLRSSNGTFVDEERVTEQTLRSGQIIQFGSQGPKVRVTFSEALAESTGQAPIPAEGHTVMMMMPHHDAGTTPAGAPASMASRKKKKGGLGRTLFITATIGGVLLIGFVALAFMIRTANIRKQRQARATRTTPATATGSPQTDTAVAAIANIAEAEELRQQIAEAKQALETAQESIKTGDPDANEITDLRRQIAESQALMEQMTRQLQEKNDEIAAERMRADSRPRVVYVPVATPQATSQVPPSPQPVAPVVPSALPAAVTLGSPSEQPSIASAPPPEATPGPRSATSSSIQRKAPPSQPPVASEPLAAAPNLRRVQPSETSAVSALPPSKSTAPSPPAAPLYKTKSLKLKVSISSIPAEIAPANLPSGTDKGLVSLIGTALVSSGDYVVGANGQASVSVMVTNYKADVKKNVNTQSVTSSVRKIGKLFGQKVPGGNPVDVKSVSYDAAMSARVRLLDRAGRVILETEPSSASADRKAKVGIAGVSFNDAVLSDTAVGDVARKVVADAVDSLRGGLGSIEWSTPVTGASRDKVVLGIGSSAHVEPGDVFEVVDADQRVQVRVRVTNVTETTSDAAFLTTPGKDRLSSMTARYVGNESASTPRRSQRTITTRAKTPVFDGPGTSFNQVRELQPGVRLNLQFTVGPWAKASDGSGTVWVPLANATIGS